MGRLARFVRARRGAAAVEFALLATMLMSLTAAAIDLINISAFNREIERSSTQIASAIVSCPASSTPGYLSCTTDTIQAYTDRKANVLVRFPSMTLGILQINEVSGAIRVCRGTSTSVDADIAARALAVLNELDVAIVVVMSMTYRPYLPQITRLFTGTTTNDLRGYTIAVQVSNVKLC
ncbi:hypothetical protein Q8W71_07550 [Methylobacterium sp. NEAU 140]|uniref:TadE/TadG family type IV pilus assembly protein n=1 Tax=Methylobacterium sp. NEAU 140 TaxID=3064945 RepID=UPI0027348B47|nr:hypothetical protein [Methylobacterium sp. NEAU 140]MDP4022472.1 hypothetical protein [Methylobacterium sp. NEAU 140]